MKWRWRSRMFRQKFLWNNKACVCTCILYFDGLHLHWPRGENSDFSLSELLCRWRWILVLSVPSLRMVAVTSVHDKYLVIASKMIGVYMHCQHLSWMFGVMCVYMPLVTIQPTCVVLRWLTTPPSHTLARLRALIGEDLASRCTFLTMPFPLVWMNVGFTSKPHSLGNSSSRKRQNVLVVSTG